MKRVLFALDYSGSHVMVATLRSGKSAFTHISCLLTNSRTMFLHCWVLSVLMPTPKRGPMVFKRLGNELLFFALTVAVSLLFWFVLASFTEQCVIVKDCVYIKERNAFFVTVAFFYFVRLSTWAIRSHSSSQ